jgi:hypothetical protein
MLSELLPVRGSHRTKIPAVVVKQGELMLAHVRLTDSAFINSAALANQEMGRLIGRATSNAAVQHCLWLFARAV